MGGLEDLQGFVEPAAVVQGQARGAVQLRQGKENARVARVVAADGVEQLASLAERFERGLIAAEVGFLGRDYGEDLGRAQAVGDVCRTVADPLHPEGQRPPRRFEALGLLTEILPERAIAGEDASEHFARGGVGGMAGHEGLENHPRLVEGAQALCRPTALGLDLGGLLQECGAELGDLGLVRALGVSRPEAAAGLFQDRQGLIGSIGRRAGSGQHGEQARQANAEVGVIRPVGDQGFTDGPAARQGRFSVVSAAVGELKLCQ